MLKNIQNKLINQLSFIRMHKDSKGLAITTSFFEDNFLQKNTIVSHSRNSSGNQQLFSSIIALQNLFKTLLLKQLFTGWVRIQEKVKNNSLKRSRGAINLRGLQQLQNQQLNRSEDNGKIIQRQQQNVQEEEQLNKYRQIYKKYGRSKTIEERRSKTQQKIKLADNHHKEQNNQRVKVLSSILQKLKKKKQTTTPQVAHQAKMDLRITKLEKMMVRIKKEHQQMRCGKFIYKSQPKSSRVNNSNPELAHYKKQIKLLQQQLQKVKVQNFKLTSSLGYINQTSNIYNQAGRVNIFSQQQLPQKIEANQGKKNFFTPIKHQQYRNNKVFSSLQPPRFFTPLKSTLPTEHVPSFITRNNSPSFQNPQSSTHIRQQYQPRIYQSPNKFVNGRGINLNTSSSLNHMPNISSSLNYIQKSNQLSMSNPLQRKMLNPQAYMEASKQGNNMLKMTKYDSGGNLNNLMNLKICRPQCKCCCHHGCKH